MSIIKQKAEISNVSQSRARTKGDGSFVLLVRKNTQRWRSLVVMNEAPSTHSRTLLGAGGESTSEANVTCKLHQQKDYETSAAWSCKEIMGKNKGEVRRQRSAPQLSSKPQRTSPKQPSLRAAAHLMSPPLRN